MTYSLSHVVKLWGKKATETMSYWAGKQSSCVTRPDGETGESKILSDISACVSLLKCPESGQVDNLNY